MWSRASWCAAPAPSMASPLTPWSFHLIRASSRLKHSARPDSMSSPVSASITANFREELPQLRINTNLLMFYIFLCFGFMPTVSCHPTWMGFPCRGLMVAGKCAQFFNMLSANPDDSGHSSQSGCASGYRPASRSRCTLTTSFFTLAGGLGVQRGRCSSPGQKMAKSPGCNAR